MQEILLDLQSLATLVRLVSPLIIGLFAWYLWTLKQKFITRKEYEKNRKEDKKEFYTFKDEYIERQHKQDLIREQNTKDITYIKENITEIKDTLKRKL